MITVRQSTQRPFFSNLFWLCAWLGAAWQAATFASIRQEVLSAAGTLRYHSEDGWIVGIYYCLFTLLVLTVLASLATWAGKRFSLKAAIGAFALGHWAWAVIMWFDLRLYRAIGLHVFDPVMFERLREPTLKNEVGLGEAARIEILLQLATQVGVVLLCGVAAYLLLNLSPRLPRFARKAFRRGAIAVPLLLTVTWAVAYRVQVWSSVQILDALPAYRMFGASPDELLAQKFNYPSQLPRETLNGKTLVILAVESLQYGVLSSERMPLTLGLVNKHPDLCQARANHYTAANTTEYGIFSLLYGLNGDLFRYFRKNKLQSAGLQHLKAAGYKIEGYATGDLQNWGTSGFIFKTFDHYEQYKDGPTDEMDLKVTAALKRSLTQAPAEKKLVFGFYVSTHHDYTFPPKFAVNQPVVPLNYSGLEGTMSQDEFRTGVRNRYFNSVRFVDSQIDEVLQTLLPRLRKGEVEILITGDHGEEMWENGQVGHASVRFYSQRFRVPLIWCGQRLAPNTAPFSTHADVLATLLESAGADATQFKKYLNGHSLRDAPAQAQRPLAVLVGTGYPEVTRRVAFLDQQLRTYWMRDEWTGIELIRVTDKNDKDLEITPALKAHWETLVPHFREQQNQLRSR